MTTSPYVRLGIYKYSGLSDIRKYNLVFDVEHLRPFGLSYPRRSSPNIYLQFHKDGDDPTSFYVEAIDKKLENSFKFRKAGGGLNKHKPKLYSMVTVCPKFLGLRDDITRRTQPLVKITQHSDFSELKFPEFLIPGREVPTEDAVLDKLLDRQVMSRNSIKPTALLKRHFIDVRQSVRKTTVIRNNTIISGAMGCNITVLKNKLLRAKQYGVIINTENGRLLGSYDKMTTSSIL